MGGAKDDIDSLRTPWESDDQWNLRSAFLNKHWDSGEFSHDRIVCLSQMFINIEFLGCSYDERVMPVVARLSAGLSDEYRERRRHVVQQTFVPQGSHAPVDPRASRVSHEHRKRTSDLGTRDPNAAEAKRLKKELLAASNESSVEMNRCKAILGIKAELSSGPTGLGPIEQLNAACNRCKLPWRLVDAPPEGGLLRRDVVIDQAPDPLDMQQASQADMSTEHFSSVLFVRDDNRQDYRSPAEDTHLHTLDKLVKFAKDRANAPFADFAAFVGAAELADISAEIEMKQLAGWQVEHALLMDKVLVTKLNAKATRGDADANAKKLEIIGAGLASLRQPHVKIVEDNQGRPALLAADQPIDDTQVAKFVQAGK